MTMGIFEISFNHCNFSIHLNIHKGARLLNLCSLGSKKTVFYEAEWGAEREGVVFMVYTPGDEVPKGMKYFAAYPDGAKVGLVYVPESMEIA